MDKESNPCKETQEHSKSRRRRKRRTLWERCRDVVAVANLVRLIFVAGAFLVLNTLPSFEFQSVEIAAYTGQPFAVWYDNPDWDIHPLSAPQVPAQAKEYVIGPAEMNIVSCSKGYKPVAAWHETVGSWPDPGVIYSINADVNEDGNIVVWLRTRQRYARGYAYVEVLVQCHASSVVLIRNRIEEIARRITGGKT